MGDHGFCNFAVASRSTGALRTVFSILRAFTYRSPISRGILLCLWAPLPRHARPRSDRQALAASINTGLSTSVSRSNPSG